jgi:hypothetical protein
MCSVMEETVSVDTRPRVASKRMIAERVLRLADHIKVGLSAVEANTATVGAVREPPVFIPASTRAQRQ